MPPWVNERYGIEPKTPPSPTGWVQDRYAPNASDREQIDVSQPPVGWVQQRFALPAPDRSQKPSTGKKVAGIPYPVAQEEVQKPGFFSNLSTTLLGPAQGPLSTPEQIAEYEAAKKELPKSAVKLQENLAQTIPGELALRAEQGVSSLAGSALSLASQGLGTGKLSQAISQDETARAEFLKNAEKGGSLSKLIGESGADIANETAEFVAKLPFLTVAGPAAFIPLLGAESFDKNIRGIKESKPEWSGGQHVLYSGAKAGLDMFLLHYLGKAGEKLGVATLERAMANPAMRDAASALAEKYGANKAIQTIVSSVSGMTADAGKMAALSAAQQGLDKATGVRKKFDFGDILKSAATGAAIRIGPEVAKATKQLESFVRRIPKSEIDAAVSGATEAAPVDAATAAAEAVAPAVPTPGAPEPAATAGQPTPTAPAGGPAVPAEAPQTAQALPIETPLPAEPGQPAEAPAPAEGAAAPPERVAPSDLEPIPQGVSVKNARMRQLAREFDRGTGYYSPERRSFRQSANLAIEAGIPEKALSIATEIAESPRQLTDVESAGFALKIADIRDQRKQALQEMAAAQTAGDTETVALNAYKANRLATEFDLLHTATVTSGTEQGRAFAARKGQLDDETDDLSMLASYRISKGAELTHKEESGMRSLVTDINNKDVEVAAARQKQNDEIVQKVIQRAKEIGKPEESLEALSNRLKELLAAGCNLE